MPACEGHWMITLLAEVEAVAVKFAAGVVALTV